LSVLLFYIYISIKKTFTIEIYTTIVDISIISEKSTKGQADRKTPKERKNLLNISDNLD
jgi:hypothetical protein